MGGHRGWTPGRLTHFARLWRETSQNGNPYLHGYIDHWLFGQGLQVMCFPHDKETSKMSPPHDYDMFIKREDGRWHTLSPHNPHREDFLDPKLIEMRGAVIRRKLLNDIKPPDEFLDQYQP